MISEVELAQLNEKHSSPPLVFLDRSPITQNEFTEELVDVWYSDRMPTMLKLFMACNMVLLDSDPGIIAYPIFCHVRYDSEPIINEVARLFKKNVYFNDVELLEHDVYLGCNEGESRGQTEKFVVWEGFTKWKEMLQEAGVSEWRIKTVGPVYNTPDEHLEIINLAKENNLKGVNLVGSPYHMVRIALGAVQHMKRTGYWVKMYFNAPKIFPGGWQETVKGAQGDIIGDGERYNQLFEEFTRIPEYMLKEVRDLSTFDDLISYIRVGRESIENGKLTVPLTSIVERFPDERKNIF